jgi:hypothetical protein
MLLPSSAHICLFHYSVFFRHVTCSLKAARLVPCFPRGRACSICESSWMALVMWPWRFWFQFCGDRTFRIGWCSPTAPARKLSTRFSFIWKGPAHPQCLVTRFPEPGEKTWLLALWFQAHGSAWVLVACLSEVAAVFSFILLCLRWMACLIPYSWSSCSAGRAWRIYCSMGGAKLLQGAHKSVGSLFSAESGRLRPGAGPQIGPQMPR